VATVTAPSRRRAGLAPAGSSAGYLYRRPEWSVVLLIVVAAIGFAVLTWVPAAGHLPAGATASPGAPATRHSGGHLAAHSSGSSAPDWTAAATYLHGVATWELMVAAMMLPAGIPLVRYVAFATRRARRQRSIAFFCLGYLFAWLPLGAVAATWHLLDVPARTAAVIAAVALAFAGAWELLPVKVRALRRCHRTVPIRYRGRAADRSSARLGLVNGQACVLSCGPAMIALVVLGHPIVATAVVGVVMYLQATHRRGDQWRGYVAALGFLGACAILAGF
jgi:predicted metal-binding membrane protein